MIRFLELDETNTVINAVHIGAEIITDENGNVNEQMGIDHMLINHGQGRRWIMSTDEGNFRGHFGFIGDVYDENLDIFISPQQYPSWTLDTQTGGWDPPTPKPELTQQEIDSNCYYEWDESEYELNNNGWKLICL